MYAYDYIYKRGHYTMKKMLTLTAALAAVLFCNTITVFAQDTNQPVRDRLRDWKARNAEPDPITFDTLGISGDHYVQLEYDGRNRSVIVHIPPTYDDNQNDVPLVFMLHGGSGTARQASKSYLWKEKSDEEGFIVIFPDGTGSIQTWNVGHCCGSARKQNVDDVGFIQTLVDEAIVNLRIDTARIYATGMSNGGMLSHKLASEMSTVFAAVAPVAGTIGGQVHPWSDEQQIDPPEQPIPIIMFHGELDTNVQYYGGESQGGFPTNRIDMSQEDCIFFWVEENGTITTPDIHVSDSGNIITRTYEDPNENADVIHITIADQGHAWPGGVPGFGDPPTQEISATDLAWDFFVAHPMQ